MATDSSRRAFIKTCSAVCAGCAFFLHPHRMVFGGEEAEKTEKLLDPDAYTYCGYQCSEDCKLYKATIQNDPELKKQVYQEWEMEKNQGIEFDPDKIFCYGCKADDKPMSLILQKCTVRHCAKGRNVDVCFQCKDLKTCDMELWSKYPDFKKHVISMQEKYIAQTGNALK